MKKLESRPWWPELVKLKDALSLRELAARYGVAPAAISNALNRQGITRTPAPPGPRNKRSEEAQRRSQAALNSLKTESAKTKSTALPKDSATKASLPGGSTITPPQGLEGEGRAPETQRDQQVWEVDVDRPVMNKLFIVGELADVAARLSKEKLLSLRLAGTTY